MPRVREFGSVSGLVGGRRRDPLARESVSAGRLNVVGELTCPFASVVTETEPSQRLPSP